MLDVRPAQPRRREFGSERDGEQERKVRRAIHCKAQQLERSRVDPVKVLEHHQRRLTRKPFELRHQGLKHFLAPFLRSEVERRVAALGGN